jgi:hypothetical protein
MQDVLAVQAAQREWLKLQVELNGWDMGAPAPTPTTGIACDAAPTQATEMELDDLMADMPADMLELGDGMDWG